MKRLFTILAGAMCVLALLSVSTGSAHAGVSIRFYSGSPGDAHRGQRRHSGQNVRHGQRRHSNRNMQRGQRRDSDRDTRRGHRRQSTQNTQRGQRRHSDRNVQRGQRRHSNQDVQRGQQRHSNRNVQRGQRRHSNRDVRRGQRRHSNRNVRLGYRGHNGYSGAAPRHHRRYRPVQRSQILACRPVYFRADSGNGRELVRRETLCETRFGRPVVLH